MILGNFEKSHRGDIPDGLLHPLATESSEEEKEGDPAEADRRVEGPRKNLSVADMTILSAPSSRTSTTRAFEDGITIL